MREMFSKKKCHSFKTPQIIDATAPFAYGEAYKDLRTNFNFVAFNGKKKKIVVTSTLQDEGKSSVAVNLAISLAQTGSRVLLIDADMRNPSLHRYLKVKKEHDIGLSTLLNGNYRVGDWVLQTKYGIDIIPGGPTPPNPAELIGSPAMKSLLQGAEETYDYVICDAPPVGVITDAAALSAFCDGVLFVIRQGMAGKSQIMGALRKLETVDAKILGTVLNQYDIAQDMASGNKHYFYRYGSYRTVNERVGNNDGND